MGSTISCSKVSTSDSLTTSQQLKNEALSLVRLLTGSGPPPPLLCFNHRCRLHPKRMLLLWQPGRTCDSALTDPSTITDTSILQGVLLPASELCGRRIPNIFYTVNVGQLQSLKYKQFL